MRGLRLQLASLFLLAVLPGLVALVGYDLVHYRDEQKAEAAQLLSRVHLVAAPDGVVLQGVSALLSDLANRDEIRNAAAQPSLCTQALAAAVAIHPEIAGIGLFNSDGDLVCGKGDAQPDRSARERVWFAHVRAMRSFAIGEDRMLAGSRVITAGYPLLRGNGEFTGAIGVDISVRWLGGRFAQLALEDGVVLTLFDRNGTALARYPDPDRLTGRTLGSVAARIAAGADGSDETEFLDGTDRIAAFAPFGGKDWHGLTMSIDVDPAFLLAGARWNLALDLASLLSVVLVGACVAFYYGGKLLLSPIREIGSVADRLSAGDMDARVGGPYRDNELGRVARAFDGMAEAICLRDQELRRANEYKSRVLAIAGHDLRQPLQIISMSHELIGRALGNPKLQRQLDRADRAVQRLLQQLDHITSAGKLDEGALAPAVARVPLGPMLAEVVAEHAAFAEAKGLTLAVAATSAVALTDREMLATILRNLVGNAVKYTERGGVLVGCRRAGADIALDVCDSGIGIPQDRLSSVFEEFLQLDPKSDGMGLGLAIVKRTADALGHAIEVRSAVGRGTRFRLILPRAKENPDRVQLRSA